MSDFAGCVARTLTGVCSMFFDVLFILHPSSVQTPNASSGGIGKTVRPCSLNLRRSGGGGPRAVARRTTYYPTLYPGYCRTSCAGSLSLGRYAETKSQHWGLNHQQDYKQNPT